jgi:hypothetical protein
MSDLIEKDISKELWREYEWVYFIDERPYTQTYRIKEPKKLFYRLGGTTHRVVDSWGIVHCIPVPGQLGCVLRWKNLDPEKPVNF